MLFLRAAQQRTLPDAFHAGMKDYRALQTRRGNRLSDGITQRRQRRFAVVVRHGLGSDLGRFMSCPSLSLAATGNSACLAPWGESTD
jgi:hypothetical protein